MVALFHEEADFSKLPKVYVLLGFQRVLDEKWQDAFYQVIQISHSVGHPVAVILSNHSESEVSLECVEHLHIAFVLYDGEFR